MVTDFENSSICLGIGVTLDTLVSAKLDFNWRQCVHMHYQMTFKNNSCDPVFLTHPGFLVNHLIPNLSNLLLLLSFSTWKHMSVASSAILSNFFEQQCTQNHPQYLSGMLHALFSTTFLEIAVYAWRLRGSYSEWDKKSRAQGQLLLLEISRGTWITCFWLVTKR